MLLITLLVLLLQLSVAHDFLVGKQREAGFSGSREVPPDNEIPNNDTLASCKRKPATLAARTNIANGEMRFACNPWDVARLEIALRRVAQWSAWAHQAINNLGDAYNNEAFSRCFSPDMIREHRLDIAARYADVMAEARAREGRITIFCDYEGVECRGPFEGAAVARRMYGCNFYIVSDSVSFLLAIDVVVIVFRFLPSSSTNLLSWRLTIVTL